MSNLFLGVRVIPHTGSAASRPWMFMLHCKFIGGIVAKIALRVFHTVITLPCVRY